MEGPRRARRGSLRVKLREPAMRAGAGACQQDRQLSLSAAVLRIGPRVEVSPDTLRGWFKQVERTHRGDEPADQENQAGRARLPQLRQQPTQTPASTAESTGRLHNQHGSEAGYHAWLRRAAIRRHRAGRGPGRTQGLDQDRGAAQVSTPRADSQPESTA
jgi:transposase-like protein